MNEKCKMSKSLFVWRDVNESCRILKIQLCNKLVFQYDILRVLLDSIGIRLISIQILLSRMKVEINAI
jgi:hypothetical protein